MSTVAYSQTTPLVGQPLRDRIGQAAQSIASRSPYSLVGMTSAWQGANRLTLAAGGHMNGAVDVVESRGQSTVTATINLTSALAEGQRSRVESDLRSTFAQYLAADATAPAGQGGQQPTAPATPRNRVDSDQVTDIFETITAGLRTLTTAITQPAGTASVATTTVTKAPVDPNDPRYQNYTGSTAQPFPWGTVALGVGGVVVVGGLVWWLAKR